MRKAKRDLEKVGIARFLEKYITNADGTRRRDRDIFVPLFDLYEAMDKRDGKGLDQDAERNRQAVNAAKREAAEAAAAAAVAAVKPDIDKINRRIDKHDFDFSRLHADLQQWRDFLEYSGKYGKTTYFTAKPGAVSPAFVESEFKRHGLSVVVKAG